MQSLPCYSSQPAPPVIPIHIVKINQLNEWLASQSTLVSNWFESIDSTDPQAGDFVLVPDSEGHISQVVILLDDLHDIAHIGKLPQQLPSGSYYIATELERATLQQVFVYWGLGAYQFRHYQSQPSQKTIPQLSTTDLDTGAKHHLDTQMKAIYWVRNLINIPAEDMGPEQLANEAQQLADFYQAECQITQGQSLLDDNFPAIHRVGRAAHQEPRLIDIRWGNENAPVVTLVGKGVCFDTGGLDLKPGSNMRLMKKDMGGAAHVLGLAAMIMNSQLNIRLRVLIPAVDNAVSGNAYRPSDIIRMRSGKFVEVTNTDAEGRLVMADAISLACEESPELLIDFATLTGAARVAVGTDIAAYWTTDNTIASGLNEHAQNTQDHVWQLPLHKDYKRLLKSQVADCVNANVASPYAGAITAALFLQQFVASNNTQWLHFDIMGYNTESRPGHPQGGEAMGLRTVFEWLRQRYTH